MKERYTVNHGMYEAMGSENEVSAQHSHMCIVVFLTNLNPVVI